MALTRSVAGVAGGLLLSGGAAFGHHAFSAEFDANTPVMLEGAITRIEWANPHTYLNLDVKDESGKTANWRVELASSDELRNRRWTVSLLRVGQHVSMKGWQAKNGSTFANADSIMMTGEKLTAASSYYLDPAVARALARNGTEPRTVGTGGNEAALPATAGALPYIVALGTLAVLGARLARRAAG